jgi:Flp pilus assembly protein TadB
LSYDAGAFRRGECDDEWMRRAHDQPPLITSAPQSSDDEFDRRRKRYAVMMGLRALCVIGAALTYRVSMLLAMAFVVGGVVLPWCAVIIANDRPPKKRQQRSGYVAGSTERALPPGQDDRVVDG